MAKRHKEKGKFKKRVSCPFESCGSSDAGALYEHEDGSWSYKCFSAGCGKSIYSCDPNTFKVIEEVNGREINWEEEMEKLEGEVSTAVAGGTGYTFTIG